MKQDRRNNCLFDLLSQKSIADTLDIVKIAKKFACAKEQNATQTALSSGMRMAERRKTRPHVSKRSAAGHLNSNKYLTQ